MAAGDRVRLVGDPGRVGILTGRDKTAGNRRYQQVAFQDRIDYVPDDQLEPVPEGGDAAIDLLRRGRFARPQDLYRTLTHIRLSGRLANFIYSLETTDTDFHAYQFKPVLKLLQSASSGILIADEVGLGKTIEAGLIWTELRARFDLQRLLVVCPAMLREKWAAELARRFGVKADILSAAELLRLLRGADTGAEAGFAAVVSLQGVRPPGGWRDPETQGPAAELARLLDSRAHEEPLVDLLVVDEAHYLRNPETRAAELGVLLRRTSQYALLLSATPVHLRQDDLLHLLGIVDEDLYYRHDIFDFILQANERLVQAREAVLAGGAAPAALASALRDAMRHPLLQGNRQLEGIVACVENLVDLSHPKVRVEVASRLESANLLGYAVTRTRRRDVKEWRAIREPRTLSVPMDELEERFYTTVTETVREFCDRSGQSEGFLLVMPQRQMASCMAAAHWYWSQDEPGTREELFEDLGIELPDAEPGSLGPLISELRNRVSALGNLAELAKHDTKYERLVGELRTFLGDRPGEKVVLFSSFRHTLKYLAKRLCHDGVSCGLLLGGQDEKQQILDEFEDPRGPSVLLSSEVGSEGIDLQFSWVVVNYDLPWNPMRVEQRIGRLDRLGQESPKVVIWNLVHADTIDDRIYQRLLLRLGVFTRTLGGLEGILGARIEELTRDLFRQHLTAEQEAERIDLAGVALENQRQQEEALEEQAASLVEYGDYIIQQVEAARGLARRIKAEDIQRYVLDFLSQNYPGCRFLQDADDPALVDVELSPEAKFEFGEYLRARKARQIPPVARNDPAPVRCRFENRLRVPKGRHQEVINQFHPLVRFVAHAAEERKLVQSPAVAVRVPRDRLDGLLAAGEYRFAVTRWVFEAIRIEERLWYGVEACDSGERLSEEDAERVVTAVAQWGEDWPKASGEVDATTLAEALWEGLLVEAQERYERHVAQVVAENEDRADTQHRSLQTHLARQQERHEELIRRHVQRGYPGLAKAEEKNLARLRAKVEQQRLALENRRRLVHSTQVLCVGAIRVE